MATVSNSVDIFYGVRVVVSPGLSVALQYRVRQQVTNLGYSIIYSDRMITPQGKVFNVVYGVRATTSKNEAIAYGVRVPIASPVSLGLVYGVRKSVSTSNMVVYNTGVTGLTQVSKSFGINYHTLIKTSGGTGGAFSTAFSNAYDSGVGTVKPEISKVIVVPTEVAPVPPQIITTSF
jgi:hypothetical protein